MKLSFHRRESRSSASISYEPSLVGRGLRVDMDSIENAEKIFVERNDALRSDRVCCEDLPLLSPSQQQHVQTESEPIDEVYDPEVEWA